LLVNVLRHELIDTSGWMAFGNGLQCSLEIGVWLDAVELTGFNERCDARPSSAAFVVAREQRIFAVKGDGSNGALDGVAVHLDDAVIEE
jgi:hypothetical protein